MATITAKIVGDLRAATGLGMMECKKALVEAEGDFDKAEEILRIKSGAKAGKLAGRTAAEGIVVSSINGQVGALVEINCETDFVAKTDDFKTLVKDIAMHIAAANPLYVLREEVPAEILTHEREILKAQAINEGKPENIAEKMVEGRIEKYYKDHCLMDQIFVKDGESTITELIKSNIAKMGENITIRRFARFNLGEGLEKKETDFAAEVLAAAQQ